jgi:hypothetical protein
MFEGANAWELKQLALDATPSVPEEPDITDPKVPPKEPSPEVLASSPKHWSCLWSID